MAPELFSKSGYLQQVDWWSLGIVMFECLFGKRPFRGSSHEETQKNIQTQQLTIPTVNLVSKRSKLISAHCANLITRFLERDVSARICCVKDLGIVELQTHPWFESIDWEKLEKKEETPRFIPEPDKDNFDISHDLEELLLEDNPLKYKPRKKKKDTLESSKSKNGSSSQPKLDVAKKAGSADGQEEYSSNMNVSPSFGNLATQVSTADIIPPGQFGRHPADYDPYLQALQKNEHPEKKGVKITKMERYNMEMEYIEKFFSDFDYKKVTNSPARELPQETYSKTILKGKEMPEKGVKKDKSSDGLSIDVLKAIPNEKAVDPMNEASFTPDEPGNQAQKFVEGERPSIIISSRSLPLLNHLNETFGKEEKARYRNSKENISETRSRKGSNDLHASIGQVYKKAHASDLSLKEMDGKKRDKKSGNGNEKVKEEQKAPPNSPTKEY